jgi:hypothetical protein
MAEVLKRHIEECPEHPMSKLKIRNTELEKKVKNLIEFAQTILPANTNDAYDKITAEMYCQLRDKDRAEQKELEAENARLREVVNRPRPQIVCLCGSTRYMEAFFAAGWQLTLMGQIVLSVGVCKHTDGDGAHGAEAAGVAEQLDELHKRKIDLADWVLVLNVGGYYGSSTASEIEYARQLGKSVKFISQFASNEPVPADYVEWDAVMTDVEEIAREAAEKGGE